MSEVEVEVWRLVQDERGKDVLLLRDAQRRHLPIWIGQYEAAAIWVKLEAQRASPLIRRPMTHDLCTTIIERLGARVARIVVDDFSNETYYAKLHLVVDGAELTIDSRPSDAIAIALRCGAPIWVADRVMEAGNIAVEEHDTPAEPPDDAQALDDDQPEPLGPQEE